MERVENSFPGGGRMKNIFEGVEQDAVWKATGGPKLVQLISAVIIFAIVLAIFSKFIPRWLLRPLVAVGFLAIFFVWIQSI